MKKVLQICNLLAFVAVIVVNYGSNTGMINDRTIGEMSGMTQNLFTPAGYAFAIWGLIYLLLLGFIVYQIRSLFKPVRDDSFLERIGWWFVLSCIANITWIVLWLNAQFGYSVIAMFFLLFCLLRIVVANRMELWDAPISVIVFLWWPFVIYSGWITVASIANVAAYLTAEGWTGGGLGPVVWTLILIAIATVVNLWVTWTRNMREFALVGAWALLAIAAANWDSESLVAQAALFSAGILIGSSAWHGIKNFKTNPLIKLQQYYAKK